MLPILQQKYGEDQTQFTLSMLITGETMRPACDLLATLCATFGQHMMRYRSPVTGMLMSALNASSSPSHPDGTTTSSVGDNALRIATYRATSSAIASLGPTFVRAVQQALMGAVLGDVTGDPLACMLDETIQQSVEQTSGSRGAGRKRKHQQSTTSSSFVSMNGSTASAASAPLDVKIAALQVAQSALDCGASMLNVSLRNKLDRLVIKALLLEESRAISPFYVSSHASAAAPHLTIYRAHLYETLLASVSAPAFASPTVLPLALHAFATGTQDGALMVRAVCHRAMVYCDALLKPRLPPLMRRATLRKYLAQVEREEEREAEEEVEAEENKTLHVETEDVETMTEDVAVEMRGQVAMAPISAKSVSAPAAVDIDTLISSSPVKKARQEEPRATSITVPIVEPPQMDTNLVEEPVVETQQMGMCLAKEPADAPTIEPKRELPDSEQEAADEELDDLDDFEIVDAAPDAA